MLTSLLFDIERCIWSQTNPYSRLYIQAPSQIWPNTYRLATIGQLRGHNWPIILTSLLFGVIMNDEVILDTLGDIGTSVAQM